MASRPQCLGEEIGNAVTHGVGALFGIAALVLLMIKSDSTIEYVACAIFSLSIILLYTMSCLYHSFKNDTKVKRIFRIFDHLSIFLLIGGTYAPVLLLGCNNTKGLIIFTIQWTLIAIGTVLRFILKGKKMMVVHTVISVIVGWIGLLIMPDIYSVSIPFFYLILGGGIAYTLGLFFFCYHFKYSHFIWHFFVIFGTVLHFIAIYLYLL